MAAYALGMVGAALSQVLCVTGAAIGTAKASEGIFAAGVMKPELVMKSIVPVIMAGIIAIYGLVVSLIIKGKIIAGMSIDDGFLLLSAGAICGLCGLAAGYAIGVVGNAGVRGASQQPKLYVSMVLILIFSEVLGLYGMIVALILATSSTSGGE